MDRTVKKDLLRYLRGELGPAEAGELDRLMAADPAVRAEFNTMKAVWSDLENPPPPPAPDDFADLVLDRIVRDGLEPARSVAWPAAMRWAAAGVAFSGVALGAYLGSWASEDASSELLYAPPSLAESYVVLLEETE